MGTISGYVWVVQVLDIRATTGECRTIRGTSHGIHRIRQLAQPVASVGAAPSHVPVFSKLTFCHGCHVDGLRFDLASALAREFYEVDRLIAFFDTIHQDPVLSQVKLISGALELGFPVANQVGNFPGSGRSGTGCIGD